MPNTIRFCKLTKAMLTALVLMLSLAASRSYALNLADQPLFLTKNEPPLVMLVMERDHRLSLEAYNDVSDLNGDGNLDYVYKPAEIDYYGYFDSFKCYTYVGSKFVPSSKTTAAALKKCTGAQEWSGDWLNYNTMTRMDTLRKVLYGGNRSTDTGGVNGETILERAYIPREAHTWAKKYESIAADGYDIQDYTPLSLPSSGRRHLFGNTTLYYTTDAPLLRVLRDSGAQPWEWASIASPVLGDQCATGNNNRYNCSANRNDYLVRVKVCVPDMPESNCKRYPQGPLKPTGLLHKYGEGDGMYFGLISGSYIRNTRGGVLRRAIGSIADEITADGRFKSTSSAYKMKGIVATIDNLRIAGFNYIPDHNEGWSHIYENFTYDRYPNKTNDRCGWIATRPMVSGECQDWGSPLGEMVYEAVRYFAGKDARTNDFNYVSTDNTVRDNQLWFSTYQPGLPVATWKDPYGAGGYPSCSKPYLLLINDTYPSFDSDAVPGSKFCLEENKLSYPCGTYSGDLAGLDVEAEGQRIWNHEFGAGVSKKVFIGQAGSNYDSAPTPKTATTLGNLRGLAPSDPTRQGSYSAAEIAHWAKRTDLNPAPGDQKLTTFSVALAAPLPEIRIPVGANTVIFVPFAKSVGDITNNYPIKQAQGEFQPTDQIVDFYILNIKNTWTKTINGSLENCLTATPAILAANRNDCNASVNSGRPYYKFRINYEDVEQGADHDMDAVALYEIFLTANNTIQVNVTSEYAAGGIIQHMGYIVSGGVETNASGSPISGASNSTYLVVRDTDTPWDVDYFLDTPRGGLPLSSTRYFKAITTSDAAITLKDPLWFAAKYGGFTDTNFNGLPDSTASAQAGSYSSEWDADADGVPDNYFFVLNPLKLEKQLDNALTNIQLAAGSASALTIDSQSYKSGQLLYQAKFSSEGWGGELIAYSAATNGALSLSSWAAHQYLSTQQTSASRTILTYDKDRTSTDVTGRPLRGIPFRWASMSTSGILQTALNRTQGGTADTLGADRVNYLRGDAVPGMRDRPMIKGTFTRNLLGDIVNSGLQYVGAPALGYVETSYASFYAARQNRKAMLYVGANDGMLHGFDANTGAELLAYVPYALYGNARLSKLTAPDYGQKSNPHAYYVDGTPTIGDICAGNCAVASDWKSILVGGLNRGGQGIYALDITDPDNFTEGNAADTVLWEFTDDMDNLPETSPSPSPFGFMDDESTRYGLGYTYSQPSIVRICTQRDASSTSVPKSCPTTNRKWVVVFGNGYNSAASGNASTSGHAMLYVLDALTGNLLTKISTKTGDTFNSGSNGLATASAVDIDGDTVADYVYAGDLNGNMWKFDLSGLKPPDWSVAYGTVAAPAPLYVATSATGTLQPITSPPEVSSHPLGGTMVLFGTGKYLESGIDTVSTSPQTFYGIRDTGKAVTPSDRSILQQQTIDSKANTTSIGVLNAGSKNVVDWSSKSGWYIDLPEPRERVVFKPQLHEKMLYFSSLSPDTARCSYGGDSWDYFVNYLTGSTLDYSPFTGVGLLDIASGKTAIAVRRKSEVGISPAGTLISKGNKGFLAKTGSKDTPPEMVGLNFGLSAPRRVSWRELTAD